MSSVKSIPAGSSEAIRGPLPAGNTPSPRQAGRHFAEGYTLIELLVVIAIIVILAALLLPVLSRGRAMAWRVKCASNQHGIGTALRLYVDDFQAYPVFGSPVRPSTPLPADVRSVYWDFKLLDYAGKQRGVFVCPTPNGTNNDTVDDNWSITDPQQNVWPNRSYGYNGAGVGQDTTPTGTIYFGGGNSCGLDAALEWGKLTYLAETKVAAPADMIAVIDYVPNGDDDGDGDFHPDAIYSMTLTGSHHNGGANAVFCDAHVEFAKTNAWLPARARWNYDHQPNPTAFPYFP